MLFDLLAWVVVCLVAVACCAFCVVVYDGCFCWVQFFSPACSLVCCMLSALGTMHTKRGAVCNGQASSLVVSGGRRLQVAAAFLVFFSVRGFI